MPSLSFHYLGSYSCSIHPPVSEVMATKMREERNIRTTQQLLSNPSCQGDAVHTAHPEQNSCLSQNLTSRQQ